MGIEKRVVCDFCEHEIHTDYFTFKFQSGVIDRVTGNFVLLACHRDCFKEFLNYLKNKKKG